jgi:hypothetical protein
MNGVGRARGRAIKGNQPLIAKDPETVAHVVRFQTRKDLEQERIAMARGHGIKESTDLVITGHLLDAQQRLGVLASRAALEAALVRSKRW